MTRGRTLGTSSAIALTLIVGGLLAGPAVASASAPRARPAASWTHTFHSANFLNPPVAWMSGRDPDPGSGDIFADSQNSFQAGPMIFSPQGQLIWFDALNHAAAFNVEVQSYQGQSVLTYWEGYVQGGVGIGRDLVLNHAYQTIATVRAADGLNADLHEFQITPSGDALITAYEPVHADLSSVGGRRNGTLLDSVIQEINIRTGKLVWLWRASRHVHVSESYAGSPSSKPYDFFHINSIQQLRGGNLLVSARNTWALYEINPRTGRIPLLIGGRHSSFKMGAGTNFEWQHDAHMNPDGTVTVFDDASIASQRNESQSRALRLRLNRHTRHATLVHAYSNRPPVLAGSQGSVQVLPDGNTFVGWGAVPYFTEFSRTGRQLFSLHLDGPLQSYRGYRFQWWGQPSTPPSISTVATATRARVYASWNGATDVTSWRVLAGQSSSTLSPVGQYPKTHFESNMWVETTQPFLAVQALGSGGQVLGTSGAVAR